MNQTKLSSFTTRENFDLMLEQFIREDGGRIEAFPLQGVTLGTVPHGDFFRIALAYTDFTTEEKYRNKVGKYLVISRINMGENTLVTPEMLAVIMDELDDNENN